MLTSFSKSWMGPFVSNSVTKHEYIGRRTVQPSNEGVQTTRIGGIAVWGCAHLIGGVYHPHWGVDKFLFVSRPRLQPVQWAATNLGSTQARLSNRSIRGPVTQSNSIYFRWRSICPRRPRYRPFTFWSRSRSNVKVKDAKMLKLLQGAVTWRL